MSGIGHNNPPKDRTFKKRWATALLSHPEKPTGAVAMGFKLYMEMDGTGCGAVISDREFSDSCGVSERACQNFKRWLVDHEFVRIQVKGARGRANAFLAVIPGETIAAPVAVIRDQIAASITGKDDECRQPMPANEHEMPATCAANRQLTAPDAGIPPRAHPRIVSPSGIIIPKNQLDKQLPPEQEAARGGGGECDAEFPALNGTAVDLVSFISKHTSTSEPEARRMLKANIGAYGSGPLMEAYSATVAEMTGGPVANPYKYLLGCARNFKDGKRSAKTSDAERRQAAMKEQNEKLRAEYGFDKEVH